MLQKENNYSMSMEECIWEVFKVNAHNGNIIWGMLKFQICWGYA